MPTLKNQKNSIFPTMIEIFYSLLLLLCFVIVPSMGFSATTSSCSVWQNQNKRIAAAKASVMIRHVGVLDEDEFYSSRNFGMFSGKYNNNDDKDEQANKSKYDDETMDSSSSTFESSSSQQEKEQPQRSMTYAIGKSDSMFSGNQKQNTRQRKSQEIIAQIDAYEEVQDDYDGSSYSVASDNRNLQPVPPTLLTPLQLIKSLAMSVVDAYYKLLFYVSVVEIQEDELNEYTNSFIRLLKAFSMAADDFATGTVDYANYSKTKSRSLRIESLKPPPSKNDDFLLEQQVQYIQNKFETVLPKVSKKIQKEKPSSTAQQMQSSNFGGGGGGGNNNNKNNNRYDAGQRVESIKCAVAGALAGSIGSLPFTYVHYFILFYPGNSLAALEYTTDMAALQGALFAIVYRYVIRGDNNPMLNQGAIGAFALTRTFGSIHVPNYCTAVPLSCGEPLGYFDWAMLSQFFAMGFESVGLFAAVAVAMDFCFESRIISKFD